MIEIDNSLSNAEIISILGHNFKGYRMALGKTQADIANETGLSLPTVSNFERGALRNISMKAFLSLLRSIGMIGNTNTLLPEIPVSPYLISAISKKQKKRIRHGK